MSKATDQRVRSMVRRSISAAKAGKCGKAKELIKRALVTPGAGAAAGDRAFTTYRLLKRRCAW